MLWMPLSTIFKMGELILRGVRAAVGIYFTSVVPGARGAVRAGRRLAMLVMAKLEKTAVIAMLVCFIKKDGVRCLKKKYMF